MSSTEEKLEKALEEIEELKQALAQEQEFNGAFLAASIVDQLKDEVRLVDAASARQRALESDTTALDAAANAWRKACEIVRENTANKFPTAQRILATSMGGEAPPQRSHLLLIALLFHLLADGRGGERGLPAEIITNAKGQRLDVVGLSDSNINKMLASARRLWKTHTA